MLKFFEEKRWLSLIITIIIALIIFYLSSLSLQQAGGAPSIFSYLYHFFAFFFLSFFLAITLITGKKKNLLALAIILAIIYAVSDEIHQLFVPYRSCSLTDILLDSVGVLLAGVFYAIRIKK